MKLPDAAANAWVIHLELPPGQHTCADLAAAVNGVQPDHGAKPLPWFLGADDRWWSLSGAYELEVRAALWLVDLNQLAYHPESTHLPFLRDVAAELEARARRVGGSIRADGSPEAAVERIAEVRAREQHRTARLVASVLVPGGADVPTWARALGRSGMQLGDGDLFWDGAVCAEPSGGYFHPRDRSTKFDRVDVHVRFARADDAALARVGALAARIAEAALGSVCHADGSPWSDARAAEEITAWRRRSG